MKSPRTLTITESNPETVGNYLVEVKKAADDSVLFSGHYAPDGGSTVIDLQGPLHDVDPGTAVNFVVTEIAQTGLPNGPAQVVAHGPYTVALLADGAENISVQA